MQGTQKHMNDEFVPSRIEDLKAITNIRFLFSLPLQKFYYTHVSTYTGFNQAVTKRMESSLDFFFSFFDRRRNLRTNAQWTYVSSNNLNAV